MKKDEKTWNGSKAHILEGLAETYCFTCLNCGCSYSRDEVEAVYDRNGKEQGWLCDRCVKDIRLAGETYQQLHRDERNK